MASPHDTAYPRLKSSFTEQELTEIYTPSDKEIEWAHQISRGSGKSLCFLILLKTFQRLGYFISLTCVPSQIVTQIASRLGYLLPSEDFTSYDASGTKSRHMTIIRKALGVQAYTSEVQNLVRSSVQQAARTKEDLADLINIAIETLIQQRYELPGFTTLRELAQSCRAEVNREYFTSVYEALGEARRLEIDRLLEVSPETKRSLWYELKQEPDNPTLSHLKELVAYWEWLKPYDVGHQVLAALPEAKVRHFAAEAKTLDAGRMKEVEPRKRACLMAALIHSQVAARLDDLGEMLVKRVHKIHQRAEEALANYRLKHQAETESLIDTFAKLLTVLQSEDGQPPSWPAIETCLNGRTQDLLNQCTAYLAYAGNNYFPFLWKYYATHRTVLFALLDHLQLLSTSQDTGVVQAIEFLRRHRTVKGDWLKVCEVVRDEQGRKRLKPLLDLSWIGENWWRLVTEMTVRDKLPDRVRRRYFELCLFSQIMAELKSGDLAIPGSDQYSDYRNHLISWDEYHILLPQLEQRLGLPTEAGAFCRHTQAWLEQASRQADDSFPDNETIRIEDGEPVLKRLERAPRPAALKTIQSLIAQRMPAINIIDALVDTENWLRWTRFFGPISGFEAKLERPREGYLTTSFAYGSFLGPTQTAKSIQGWDRKQLAWIHHRHITEESLYLAIVEIINHYNQFLLPKYWGSGRNASADGTKWDMYENNLLAEYHIRYGGYGGIGYYHVSDTYIALFSHFIPCGVWEAVYILDGLLNNTSDLQPNTIHGDTQAQSTPVFGLAYLLGIQLMPRIRNWKNLTFFKSDKTLHYPHTEALYSDTIDWKLIQTHLPDMWRIVLSIQAGRISASAILRRLGTSSRKNRLYFAFRELGRAVRTAFLLRFVTDADLRRLIQSATNKSEAFNRFIQWAAFGGHGLIAQNNRDEQRKIIKYNHLIANCLILHNVYSLTCVLQQLAQEGHSVDPELMAHLSPYLTDHINRFGDYTLNLNRPTPPLQFGIDASLGGNLSD